MGENGENDIEVMPFIRILCRFLLYNSFLIHRTGTFFRFGRLNYKPPNSINYEIPRC
ncbi:MAG: hypothetical protein ACI9YL_001225 [Luteibaculaceae bacterium]|jgi:hypothetical protein